MINFSCSCTERLVKVQFLELFSGESNFSNFREIPGNYKRLTMTMAGIPTGETGASVASVEGLSSTFNEYATDTGSCYRQNTTKKHRHLVVTHI